MNRLPINIGPRPGAPLKEKFKNPRNEAPDAATRQVRDTFRDNVAAAIQAAAAPTAPAAMRNNRRGAAVTPRDRNKVRSPSDSYIEAQSVTLPTEEAIEGMVEKVVKENVTSDNTVNVATADATEEDTEADKTAYSHSNLAPIEAPSPESKTTADGDDEFEHNDNGDSVASTSNIMFGHFTGCNIDDRPNSPRCYQHANARVRPLCPGCLILIVQARRGNQVADDGEEEHNPRPPTPRCYDHQGAQDRPCCPLCFHHAINARQDHAFIFNYPGSPRCYRHINARDRPHCPGCFLLLVQERRDREMALAMENST